MSDSTAEIHGNGQAPTAAAGSHSWMRQRPLSYLTGEKENFLGQCIQIENASYLKIGSHVADITRLTALAGIGQINSLAWLLEKLLSSDSETEADLREKCESAVKTLFSDSMDTVLSSRTHQYELWLEEVRSLDLIMAASRLRPDSRP